MHCDERRYITYFANTPKPGWYFWQEDWADCIGPYETQLDAYRAFLEYVEELEKQ